MNTRCALRCGAHVIETSLPGVIAAFEPSFPPPRAAPDILLDEALAAAHGGVCLEQALSARRAGPVVIVVSDITRPIPYARFLPQFLARIENAGVAPADIVILVATGMHRASTPGEHIEMFGSEICFRYQIVDHNASDESSLTQLAGLSWSGNRVKLNSLFVNAGLRIVTGLVEPHFMAGFSGGRKAVCPGLADLATLSNFHGHAFLAQRSARNANLAHNPLHEEALSVARAVGVDFAVQVVLNGARDIVGVFAGECEAAHASACDLVRGCACPTVAQPADIVVTSGGGYPLDATFYQCVKGIVSCLPAVKPAGHVIICAGCSEGIGGSEYRQTMAQYAGKWPDFLRDIAQPKHFIKDQWQFQMHCRALAHVGQNHLHFITPGLSEAELEGLSVTGYASKDPAGEILRVFDSIYQRGMPVALVPEGPYCAPIAASN